MTQAIPRSPRSSATIRDVAREAGVSVATVSRVLNDSGPVSGETRARIREVASRLRYIPSGAARSLITSRSSTLGVLLPDLHGEFYSEIIRGIDQTAQGEGYHLLISSSHRQGSGLRAVLRSMRGRVDGLIVMLPDVEAETLTDNLPEGLPVILLNCRVAGSGYGSLAIDNPGGAHAAVRHLLEHGHRRVAHVRGAQGNHEADERQAGYRAAMREHGGEWSAELELTGDFTQASGYRAVQELLRLRPRPTALFAANDAMAIGALSALQEAGVAVPDEVAVVGFDDIPMARYLNPALSSVHVPISELGAQASRRLMAAILARGEPDGAHEVVPVGFSPRASCGCSPSSGSRPTDSP